HCGDDGPSPLDDALSRHSLYCRALSRNRKMRDTASLNNHLILGLAFSSGFIIMSIELLGGRILAPYFGSSVYVWGSIITVFMLALSIGYLLGGKLSLHDPSLKRHSLFFIGAAVSLLPLIFWSEELMEAVFI